MKIKFIFYFIIISFKNTILSKDIIIFNLIKNEMKINDIDIYYEGKNYKKVNFILDTMSFYTILKKDNLNTKIYKESKITYVANSYRSFSGRNSYISFIKSNNEKKLFPISIFTMFNLRKKNIYLNLNKINFDGIFGLALNYSSDIAVEDTYFFGEDKKYSIMNYIYEKKFINKNIFSINDNYFILGKLNLSNNINYCYCDDKLEFSYKYFFWNCWIKGIKIENKNFSINNVFVLDSLVKGIIFPEKILLKLIDIINDYLNNKLCYLFETEFYCLLDLNLNTNLSIELKENFNLNFKMKDLFYNYEINNTKILKSIISSSKDSSTIIIGKLIYDYYFVEFDSENKKIGFSNFININNVSKHFFYNNKSILFNNKIIIIIMIFSISILFLGILINLYTENSIR